MRGFGGKEHSGKNAGEKSVREKKLPALEKAGKIFYKSRGQKEDKV